MAGWDDSIVAWTRRQDHPVTVTEISEHFGIRHSEALRRVIRLVDRGRLIDLGGYLKAPPTKRQAPDQAPPKQARIWKVAHMLSLRGRWESRECALLAEASHEYTKMYMRWLERQGHISVLRRPGRSNLYRVDPDAPPETEAPIWVWRGQKARLNKGRKS